MKRKIIYPFLFALLITFTILINIYINNNKINLKKQLSININGKRVENIPLSGHYTLESYDCTNGSTLIWDKINNKLEMSANFNSNEKCTLNFETATPTLLNTANLGDYVLYEGSNGCTSTENTALDSPFNSQCKGKNNGYSSVENKGYCSSSSYRYLVNGWRIAYKLDSNSDGTKEVYLISAGAPSCTNGNTDSYQTTIDSINTEAIKYCNPNYAYGGSCQSTYSASSANTRAINETDFGYITNQWFGEERNLTCGTTGCCVSTYSTKSCGYGSDILDNGGYYWFGTKCNSNNTMWKPTDYRSVGAGLNTSAYGVRPVIHLKQDIYITGGKGTEEEPYIIGYNTFITINDDAEFAESQTVDLKLTNPNATQMCISNTSSCTTYETYKAYKSWEITEGDGEKTVYVKFKNASGTVIASTSDTIIVDTTAPTNNSISISSATSQERTITLSSTDTTSGVEKMCISESNDSSLCNWIDYTTSHFYVFSLTTGEKTLYAFFKDAAGNISEPVSATTTVSEIKPYTVNEDFSDSTYDSNLQITGSDTYAWSVNNSRLESTNQTISSSESSTYITFTPIAPSTLSFDYGVSSESCCDKLTILLEGSDGSSVSIANVGGSVAESVSQELNVGVTYILSATYKKDTSVDTDDDLGYIDNFIIQ